MRRLELWLAAGFAGLGAVIWLDARALAYWSLAMPGPGFAPVWVGATAVALAALLVIAAVRAPAGRTVDWPDAAGLRDLAVTYALVWAAVAVAPAVGFSAAAVALVIAFLRGLMRRPWLPTLATAAFVAALVEGVFVRWLGLQLPRGALGF